jgi:hypothetical protein
LGKFDISQGSKETFGYSVGQWEISMGSVALRFYYDNFIVAYPIKGIMYQNAENLPD